MTPGIFDTVFERDDVEATYAAVAAAGFSAVQAHLPIVGIDPWSDEEPDHALVSRLGEAAKTAGVRIAALDGAFNMAHPEPEVREAGLIGLNRVIRAAIQLGVPFVTLCTGTRSRESMWRHHPDNTTPEAWSDARSTIASAIATAEIAGVTLLIEPEPANIINGTEAARKILDEIGSDNLRIVMDPANLVLSDRSRSPESVLAEGFDILGSDIVFAHGKDLSEDNRFCAAGTGIVPWAAFRKMLEGIGYDDAVIFHTLTEPDTDRAIATMFD